MRKSKRPKKAGADFVGGDDLVAKITEGWMEFDVVIATPDMMGKVGRLGRVLGPRGLMPNPKVGTVTFDVTKAVSESKGGKVSFRVEKAGIIHVPVGKVSFGAGKVAENVQTLIDALLKAKTLHRQKAPTFVASPYRPRWAQGSRSTPATVAAPE